jgi:hypothetical protein
MFKKKKQELRYYLAVYTDEGWQYESPDFKLNVGDTIEMYDKGGTRLIMAVKIGKDFLPEDKWTHNKLRNDNGNDTTNI